MSRESMAAALKRERAAKGTVAARRSAEPAATEDEASKPPSRRGKKAVVCYVDPAVSQELKVLGAVEGRSNQALLVEAINDLLAKYGKLPLA